MTTDMTVQEALNSVTGYDEIAVERHFGIDLYAGNEGRPMTMTRALVFVLKRRDGLKDAEAKQAVMNMPVGEVNDYFADAPEEIDPDDPDSELGKESPELRSAPTS